MEALKVQFNELFSVLIEKGRALDERKSNLDRKASELSKTKKEIADSLKARKIEFGRREEAIKPIENIIKFRRESKELRAKVVQESDELEKAKKQFATHIENRKAGFVTREEALKKEEEKYERELKALRVSKAEVEQERKDLKSKITDGLLNLSNK